MWLQVVNGWVYIKVGFQSSTIKFHLFIDAHTLNSFRLLQSRVSEIKIKSDCLNAGYFPLSRVVASNWVIYNIFQFISTVIQRSLWLLAICRSISSASSVKETKDECQEKLILNFSIFAPSSRFFSIPSPSKAYRLSATLRWLLLISSFLFEIEIYWGINRKEKVEGNSRLLHPIEELKLASGWQSGLGERIFDSNSILKSSRRL